MAKQGLTLEQKQKQRLALEQQRMLGLVLEKNDAEMAEFIDNKVNEIQALEKKSDDDNEYDNDNDERRNNDHAGEDTTPSGEVNSDGDDDTAAWYRYFANNRSRDDEYYAPTAVSEKTLQEYLADQLGELELDETQQIIAQAIVGNLEDDGYLRRSVNEIADDVTFNDGYMVDAKQVEQMLEIIQTLDPPGIAAPAGMHPATAAPQTPKRGCGPGHHDGREIFRRLCCHALRHVGPQDGRSRREIGRGVQAPHQTGR